MAESLAVDVLETTFDQLPIAEEAWPCRVCNGRLEDDMAVYVVGIPVEGGALPQFTCSEYHANLILKDLADSRKQDLRVSWRRG